MIEIEPIRPHRGRRTGRRGFFSRYAKPGDRILDTHEGSGTSRRAAYDFGLDFVGYEIDKVYFALQEAAFEAHAAQIRIEI